MALKPGAPPGSTPLEPEELADLIPNGVTTQGQLNAWESENILEAVAWLDGTRPTDALDEEFVRELHRRMFDRTWRWAGRYRTTGKNIGVAPEDIGAELRNLLEDVRAQVEARALPADEIAARFHHRLTRIHPFANGNGRHARLVTDHLLRRMGAEPFTWGGSELHRAGDPRSAYIEALRAADAHDIRPLIEFVRS